MIRGENFILELDGEAKRLGFYTTRFVEASAASEAEKKAIAQIREDRRLGAQLEENDLASIHVEESCEVDSDSVPEAAQGFSFFREESNA
jgi:hypothetical protein